jgi:DNA gyrase/topoisomerase IV subunit B
VERRLRELAWLNPTLHLHFQGVRLRGNRGTRGWVELRAGERGRIDAMLSSLLVTATASIDVALAWSGTAASEVRSFANQTETSDGAHIAGMWEALATYARSSLHINATPTRVRAALSPGLIAIVAVRLDDPIYRDRAHRHLISPEAADAVERALAGDLPRIVARDQRVRELLESRLRR